MLLGDKREKELRSEKNWGFFFLQTINKYYALNNIYIGIFSWKPKQSDLRIAHGFVTGNLQQEHDLFLYLLCLMFLSSLNIVHRSNTMRLLWNLWEFLSRNVNNSYYNLHFSSWIPNLNNLILGSILLAYFSHKNKPRKELNTLSNSYLFPRAG